MNKHFKIRRRDPCPRSSYEHLTQSFSHVSSTELTRLAEAHGANLKDEPNRLRYFAQICEQATYIFNIMKKYAVTMCFKFYGVLCCIHSWHSTLQRSIVLHLKLLQLLKSHKHILDCMILNATTCCVFLPLHGAWNIVKYL